VTLKLVTAPTEEPIALSEAKLHARTHDADDTLVTRLIAASRKHVETFLQRALCTQTWDWFIDYYFPEHVLELPRPPLQSVTHIKYVDDAGVLQTLDPSKYAVCGAGHEEAARVLPVYNEYWPTDVRCQPEAVQIRLVAGFGAAAAVPEDIKAALLLIVGHLYAHREENHDFQLHELPLGAVRLLAPYRVTRF
jgi:uncharacterized phiE125 gp8 family phage protein